MIKVLFTKKSNHINYFEISGHAITNTNQKDDLVCAGVSAIVFGILNSLDKYKNSQTEIKLGKNQIIIYNNIVDAKIDLILDILYIQLLTIYKTNKNYINWKER